MASEQCNIINIVILHHNIINVIQVQLMTSCWEKEIAVGEQPFKVGGMVSTKLCHFSYE